MSEYKFIPFPTLKSERLILRKPEESDSPQVFLLRSDERVLKHLGREPIQTEEEAIQFIRSINQFLEKSQSILWGIALQSDPDLLIGTICFWNLQPENYRAEIGYVLHPDFWGQRIMKEAIRTAVPTFCTRRMVKEYTEKFYVPAARVTEELE